MYHRLKVKVVVLGASNVGKSSLVHRYVHGRFASNVESTIGAAYYRHIMPPLKNKNDEEYIIEYEIWDTAGQERYNALLPMYYRNAHVILIAFSLVDRNSFAEAKRWVGEVKELGVFSHAKQPLFVLVGTKLDMAKDYRQITKKQADVYAAERDLMYIETSALEDVNVDALFNVITEKIVMQSDETSELAYSTVSLRAEHETVRNSAKRSSGLSRFCSC